MSPIESPEMLSHFPPTLFITGSRAGALSSAINTYRLLTKLGVHTDLHVWDGLGHGFFNHVDLPESREAFEVMARSFQTHWGREPPHQGSAVGRKRMKR